MVMLHPVREARELQRAREGVEGWRVGGRFEGEGVHLSEELGIEVTQEENVAEAVPQRPELVQQVPPPVLRVLVLAAMVRGVHVHE